VDKAVHRWFLNTRSKNIPVNGPFLCKWAQSFACSFGQTEFKGSTGWPHRFRERYSIHHKTICGRKVMPQRICCIIMERGAAEDVIK
jgi:hypothetical protein